MWRVALLLLLSLVLLVLVLLLLLPVVVVVAIPLPVVVVVVVVARCFMEPLLGFMEAEVARASGGDGGTQGLTVTQEQLSLAKVRGCEQRHERSSRSARGWLHQ